MRVALLGAGRIGRLHARLLSATRRASTTSLIGDVDADRAAEVAPTVGATRRRRRSTRHWTRADAIVIAAATGGPRRSSSARRSVGGCRRSARSHWPRTSTTRSRSPRTSTRSGIPFQLGFQRRFDPAYREAHRLVHERRARHAVCRPPGRPRPGAGARGVHRPVGWSVPRLLDPRLRHPALDDRLRSRGGLRRRRRPGIPGLREIRRRRHGRGDAPPHRRPADRDDRHPPRSARLRHPGRGLRLGGQRRGRASARRRRCAPSSRAFPRRPGRRGKTSSCASSRPMLPNSRRSSRSPAATPRVHVPPRTASRPSASPRRPIARSTNTDPCGSRRSPAEGRVGPTLGTTGRKEVSMAAIGWPRTDSSDPSDPPVRADDERDRGTRRGTTEENEPNESAEARRSSALAGAAIIVGACTAGTPTGSARPARPRRRARQARRHQDRDTSPTARPRTGSGASSATA